MIVALWGSVIDTAAISIMYRDLLFRFVVTENGAVNLDDVGIQS